MWDLNGFLVQKSRTNCHGVLVYLFAGLVQFDMTSSASFDLGSPLQHPSAAHHSIGQIDLSTTQSAMLRSRISPLLLSSHKTHVFRRSLPQIARYASSMKTSPVPQLSLIPRPLPAKNALQLTRAFTTTAVVKEAKATPVSIDPFYYWIDVFLESDSRSDRPKC